ncbi:MAG: hypothetical protein QUS12_15540 [Methanosarcina sp.]|nr:hypothetical protein [Methanosarcina sp.]
MQGSKSSGKYLIREASTEDIPGMLEVFNYYIENSFASYIETSVGPEFFQVIQNEKSRKKMIVFLFT